MSICMYVYVYGKYVLQSNLFKNHSIRNISQRGPHWPGSSSVSLQGFLKYSYL